MISRRYEDSNEWYNDITQEMDCCLETEHNELVREGYPGTYLIFEPDNPHKVFIRYPGATRGGIKIDSNCIIQEIQINSGYPREIYKKELEQRLEKFIGQELTWPEGVERWLEI